MKILFLCVANSARSQLTQVIARALSRQLVFRESFVQSAGSIASGKVNPLALETLGDLNYEHSGLSLLTSNTIKNLGEKIVKKLDYIRTLCAGEVCPTIEINAIKLHWPYPDPLIKNDFEAIVRQLQARLKEFIHEKN